MPDLPVRPIIAYYLEKMGKPVPELPKEEESASQPPRTPPVNQLAQGTGGLGSAIVERRSAPRTRNPRRPQNQPRRPRSPLARPPPKDEAAKKKP